MKNLPALILAAVVLILFGLFGLVALGQIDGGLLFSFTTHVLAVLTGVFGTLATRNGKGSTWSLPPKDRRK